MNLNYLIYLLGKPLHSGKYKQLKLKSSRFAESKGLYSQAVKEISDYTDEDVDRIEERRKELTRKLKETDYDSLGPEELERFYNSNEHSLYNLPMWNAECGRTQLLVWAILSHLKANKHKRILDFGAGSGDLCIALAEEGFEVSYFDINNILRDFSKWRFGKRGLKIKVLEDLSSAEPFDCLVSFDVFEHLKDLPQNLKELAGYVRPKGSLIFNIELSGEGMHLKENKIYHDDTRLNRALAQAGFSFNWKFKRIYFYKKA